MVAQPMPVVVGVARSGTTLLRLMLDAHPALAVPPETGFVPLVADLAETGTALRERVLATLLGADTWSDFGLAPEVLRAALDAVEPFDAAGGLRAFYRLHAARFGKTRRGDKTPTYCTALDRIRRVLPEARFVHLIRDGRDTALSVAGLWFAPGRDPETLAHAWRTQIEAARAEGLGRPDYLEVHYEALVTHPRHELERICAFVALPYNPAMERWYETAPARLAEHQARLRADGSVLVSKAQRLANQRLTMEPLRPDRVLCWKREMDADAVARFERVAGDLLAALGYERATASSRLETRDECSMKTPPWVR